MILREYCKAKIHGAVITQANLYYEGSITVDPDLLELSGMRPHEKVQVVNLNTGSRLDTYIIKGKAGSGIICLNGPAARLGTTGDRIHIISYHTLSEDETVPEPVVVKLNEKNRPQGS